MDRQKLKAKLQELQKNKRGLALAVTGGIGAVGVLGLLFTAGPHIAKQMSFVAQGFGLSGLYHRYGQAFIAVDEKIYEIRTAEEDNRRLRDENAHLRLQLESVQFDCRAKEAAAVTQGYERRLSAETGSKVGRTLAQIAYKPPGHLLPPQLYTLATSYFKAREDEKTAVILTFLTGLEENDAFKTPKNYLMTGVSWYRLDNFELANQYFDMVLKAPETPEVIQYQAQARLWRGLSYERMGKHSGSQEALRDLVDHHPHSTEAAWVNSREVNRATASDD